MPEHLIEEEDLAEFSFSCDSDQAIFEMLIAP